MGKRSAFSRDSERGKHFHPDSINFPPFCQTGGMILRQVRLVRSLLGSFGQVEIEVPRAPRARLNMGHIARAAPWLT
jgi:hypothetical protein